MHTFIDCSTTEVCTFENGGTFNAADCYPQVDQVCPNYFFNTASTFGYSKLLAGLCILLCFVSSTLI